MNDPFEMSQDEEDAIDSSLRQIETTIVETVPEGWTHIAIAVPNDFQHLFYETLAAYKRLRETDKDFPGFEAMVIEARNSLDTLN